jgi:hypothetical protein
MPEKSPLTLGAGQARPVESALARGYHGRNDLSATANRFVIGLLSLCLTACAAKPQGVTTTTAIRLEVPEQIPCVRANADDADPRGPLSTATASTSSAPPRS